MNILVLFDYVYYSIAYLFVNKFDYEEQKEMAGISILSVFQLFNMVALIGILYKPIKDYKNFDPRLVFIFGCCLFIILNFIRYKKFINYSHLADKWDNEKEVLRIIKIICVICYFILSVFLLAKSGN